MAMPVRQKAKVVTQIKTGGHDHDRPPVILRRKRTGNHRPQRAVSLHHHTTFSYIDGYQLPEAHVRRAEELNMSALCLTEHGNIDSHVKFEAAVEGTGIKPLFGCEVYMPTGAGALKEGELEHDEQTQRKHHLTIIAKNQQGYLNLLQLVTKSWEDFYYEPTVTWANLLAHREGLIVLSGCQGSLLFCATVGGKGIEEDAASYKRGLGVARRFRAAFGDDYFIEVQAFPELDKSRRFNPLAARMARDIGARLVGTMDCHYTMLEEQEVQKILHNLRPGEKRTVEEMAREWGYSAPLCPPQNDATFIRKLQGTGLTREQAVEAVVTTEEIAQECTVELPKLPMIRFPVPEGYDDAIDYWRALLKKGWKDREMDKLPPTQRSRAKAQLKHEMALIEAKDFVDYMLLVSSGVQYIKGLGIPVGPARGSAAASIACYLLRITEVQPLRPEFMGLLRFERFIDVTREDLPDIDLDFPSEARPLLRAFYEGIFGPGCVTNIGTFIYFKNKLAVDDVARVFHVPKPAVEQLKGFLIERSSGDMRASSTIEDTAEMFPAAAEVFDQYPDLKKAQWLEGMVKGFGVHAAGMVLSNEPITSVTTVATREVPKGSGNLVSVVALDKYDAERQGLVKMDFLGLNTMSMIYDCIRRLGMSIDELNNLPLDDEKVYDGFRASDVVGVFQFDGRAMRYVCASLKPDKFSEIMDCNALARPGPLHNGAAREYAAVKHGGKPPESFHPALDRITAPTQYQIVYQEQILTIARDVGDFGRTMVADIRRIISRKKGEQEFNKRRQEFIEGALTVHKRLDGIPPMDSDTAERIWGNMITSGAYAFNAAHCAAYGLLAYWTMWMKVYHPEVFYAASLAEAAGNPDRHRELLRDADKHDIKVYLPDIHKSEASWMPVRKDAERTITPEGLTYHTGGRPLKRRAIRAGFRQAEGFGERTAEAIDRYRSEADLQGWGDLTAMRGIGPKTILKVTDWMKSEDPFKAFQLDIDVANVRKLLADGELPGLPEPTHTSADLALAENQARNVACVWLGTFVRRNIRDIYEQNRARGHELDRETLKDPHLNEWALLTGEDDTDQLLITVDRWKYPVFKQALFDFKMGHDLLLIQAVKPARSAVRKLNVKKMWVIDPSEED